MAARLDDQLVDILGQLFRAVDDIRRQLGGKMKSHLIVEEVAEVTGSRWGRRGRSSGSRSWAGAGPGTSSRSTSLRTSTPGWSRSSG